MSAPPLEPTEQTRRTRTRRLTIVLFLVAAAFYAAFIAVSVLHGRH